MTDKNPPFHNQVLVLEPVKTALKPPAMYRVFLLNDDYTPMKFVVEVLQHFFFMSHEAATALMLGVHRSGRGICGIYTRDIAETKVVQVNEYARRNEQPLLCNMERN